MTKLVTKVSLSNFSPKAYLGTMYPPNDPNSGPGTIDLGRIYGTAVGVKKSIGADGVTETFGAKGNFEVLFAPGSDGAEVEALSSGVCYLPEAFMDPILDMFDDITDADGVVTRPAAKAVDFAFDVAIIKAGNAAKYSWQLRPLLAPAKNDPLAAVRAAIAHNAQAQLTGGTAQAAIADKSKEKVKA